MPSELYSSQEEMQERGMPWSHASDPGPLGFDPSGYFDEDPEMPPVDEIPGDDWVSGRLALNPRQRHNLRNPRYFRRGPR